VALAFGVFAAAVVLLLPLEKPPDTVETKVRRTPKDALELIKDT
jgi:hypothetical protein